jgi:CheY-like chemotaxis protein
VLLDWWLPGIDGLKLLRRYRQAGQATPVLFLTARDAVSDRVRGLNGSVSARTTIRWPNRTSLPRIFRSARLILAPAAICIIRAITSDSPERTAAAWEAKEDGLC